MERIKQALDKARAERDERSNSGQTLADNVSVQLREEEKTGAARGEISYSQTRIACVDPVVLSQNKVIYGDEDKNGLDAYKMLRTQLLQRMVARNWNALAISSPQPGDGKTLTAINLAISLARELHHTVLLVDLDLRNPSIHRYLGLKPAAGIDDFLVRGTALSEILIHPGIDRLVVLPARHPVENSSELLASPAMGELVQELKSRYPSRMVLFDLPPILSSDDALAFTPYIDAVLLVAREGKNTREDVERASEILQNVSVVGSVLNAANERTTSYY